jgi:hypothetical protein
MEDDVMAIDFSKFDLQGIMNSVKQILNPEGGATPKAPEGDPIGAKVVQIMTLLRGVADSHAQSSKDLSQAHGLFGELYKDLEIFRKLQAEMQQKQQADLNTQEEAAKAQAAQSVTESESAAEKVTPKEPERKSVKEKEEDL